MLICTQAFSTCTRCTLTQQKDVGLFDTRSTKADTTRPVQYCIPRVHHTTLSNRVCHACCVFQNTRFGGFWRQADSTTTDHSQPQVFMQYLAIIHLHQQRNPLTITNLSNVQIIKRLIFKGTTQWDASNCECWHTYQTLRSRHGMNLCSADGRVHCDDTGCGQPGLHLGHPHG